MFGTLSFNRGRNGDGGGDEGSGGVGGNRPCRYYATNRRRNNRYSSFSILKWFRRRKRYDDDGDSGDDDISWFRDDLKRIRQAYMEQESDYATVTPIAMRRGRPTSVATWCRWSSSTMTVNSFAYVDQRPGPPVAEAEDDEDDDYDDVVEYIDSATLPVSRWRSEHGQCSAATAGTTLNRPMPSNKPIPPNRSTTLNRPTPLNRPTTLNRPTPPNRSTTLNRPTTLNRSMTTGTMMGTRRRNKRAAPPPPSVVAMTAPPPSSAMVVTARPPSDMMAVAGPSLAAETVRTCEVQKRTATVSRKKYRAPQPPTVGTSMLVSLPAKPRSKQQKQQQHVANRRVVRYRHNKGPAPKPPVQPQQQQQQQKQQRTEVVGATGQRGLGAAEDGGNSSHVSNGRRKLSQHEKERLMERVDKIERHFFTDTKPAKAAAEVCGETKKPTAVAAGSHQQGFMTAAALYSAMAATNLTELDKRAAEICRRNRLGTTDTAAVATSVTAISPQRPQSAVITAEHKNAIVAAVIRKSFPDAVSASPHGKPVQVTASASSPSPRPATNDVGTGGSHLTTDRGRKPAVVVENPEVTDDEKQLVRVKRLAFFQPQTTGEGQAPSSGSSTKSSSGTQTTGSVVVTKTSSTLKRQDVKRTDGECSSETKNFPSEDNNCYQQLMAMEMQSDLVLHNGPFECAVCLCTYDNNGVVLRDCLHVFCRPCLQMTIGHSKAEEVECPYIDERYSCKGVLQHREIKKILDSEEEYERFLQRSVERARQLLAKERNGGSFQCGRPDCIGWCLIHDRHNVYEFKCPVCGSVTCVRCGSIHTQGMGCQKNKGNDSDGDTQDTLENLIDRGDAMPCPGCNTILSKQQGCDWIKCAVCYMEICWATKGPRWGPKGKGDTTAGCMCGIPPGRKCHTDCKYCH